MEGVIAREREINWSEVHFHSAFKTRRHATQFGLGVGFLCMCLYLSIWVWTKAQVYDCVRGCVCVGVSVCRLVSSGLHSLCRFTDQFLHSHHSFSWFLWPCTYKHKPSHFKTSWHLLTVYVNVSLCCVSMKEREKNIRGYVWKSLCAWLHVYSWCVYLLWLFECFFPSCLDVV